MILEATYFITSKIIAENSVSIRVSALFGVFATHKLLVEQFLNQRPANGVN